MRVFTGFDNLPIFNNAVATMGSFDGVHCGHRELLKHVTDLASENGGESIVLTFEPHPRYVLGMGEGMSLLTTLEEKLYLLERAGIDNVIVIPFTLEFSRLSPKEYIEQVVSRLGLRALVVGYNHRFGHKKEGDYDFLERGNDFAVVMVEQQQVVGSKVSSTIIRQLLLRGLTDKAATLLGHPYIIKCAFDEQGIAVAAEHKLLPTAGEYVARVGTNEVKLIIKESGEIAIHPSMHGEVIVELL